MKNELDTKSLLRVYELIQLKGEPFNEGKCYKGITAFSDFDGYTIYLEASGVLLRFGFHNTYHLDYDHANQKKQFLAKLENLIKEAKI